MRPLRGILEAKLPHATLDLAASVFGGLPPVFGAELGVFIGFGRVALVKAQRPSMCVAGVPVCFEEARANLKIHGLVSWFDGRQLER